MTSDNDPYNLIRKPKSHPDEFVAWYWQHIVGADINFQSTPGITEALAKAWDEALDTTSLPAIERATKALERANDSVHEASIAETMRELRKRYAIPVHTLPDLMKLLSRMAPRAPLDSAKPVCTFPGCVGEFHPELVWEPTHEHPIGSTGWKFDTEKEDPELPAHEHSLESPHPEIAMAAPHNQPNWNGKVFVSVTLDADPDSVEMGQIIGLEVLDRRPEWDNVGGDWNPVYEAHVNSGESRRWTETDTEAK